MSLSLDSVSYKFTLFAVLFTTVYVPFPSMSFLVNRMPPKKNKTKKKGQKRTYRENVTDQPSSDVITTMPTERAGTSGGYLDSTHPQQEESKSSGLSVARATTVVSLPSVNRTISTAGFPTSPSGLPRSFQSTGLPISTGISLKVLVT